MFKEIQVRIKDDDVCYCLLPTQPPIRAERYPSEPNFGGSMTREKSRAGNHHIISFPFSIQIKRNVCVIFAGQAYHYNELVAGIAALRR